MYFSEGNLFLCICAGFDKKRVGFEKTLRSSQKYDKKKEKGDNRMQIKNLSSAQARGFGKVLRARPEEALFVEHREITAGDAVDALYADEPVVLDYVSEMSLLVIYEENSYQLYYLDRVFELRAKLHFSIIALEGSCSVDCFTAHADTLHLEARGTLSGSCERSKAGAASHVFLSGVQARFLFPRGAAQGI